MPTWWARMGVALLPSTSDLADRFVRNVPQWAPHRGATSEKSPLLNKCLNLIHVSNLWYFPCTLSASLTTPLPSGTLDRIHWELWMANSPPRIGMDVLLLGAYGSDESSTPSVLENQFLERGKSNGMRFIRKHLRVV